MYTDFSITNKLTFMKECNLTPNEHEVIIGILMAQDEEAYWMDKEYKTEQSFPSHQPDPSYLGFLQETLTKRNLRLVLLSLQEKGVILKSCKLPTPDGEGGLQVNDVKFNKNVLKKYLRHSGEMFWELFWVYPEVTSINGKLHSLRNTFGNGGWSSIDEAASCYGNKIQYNASTHKRIIQLVENAKDKGDLNMGIIKFIRGEEWRNLDQMEENGGYGNNNTDIDFV